MGLVRGEDVILSVQQFDGTSNVYVPFACARSVTFDISTDFIETSVTESGAFKTFIPSGKQYSGNIEGLVFLNKPANGETRASTILDWSNIDPDLFPNLNSSANIDVFTLPTTTNICNLPSQEFLSLSNFINDIKNAINTSGTGFFAEFAGGNTMRILAPIGSGDTLNEIYGLALFDIDGPIDYSYALPFLGGVSPYYPDKLGIGWFYDNLISGQNILLKYYETDDENHFLQKQCSVYIESINETASFDNMVTFSVQFKGNGAPTITYGDI